VNGSPPLYGDWRSIAAFAEQLLAQRLAADPEAVKAGKLTQAQADDRARVMGAAVAIWRAVVRREPMPELQAYHAEIRLDLASARAAISTRAAAAPENTTLAQQLALAVALEWNHRGCMPGADLPWIMHVHEANLLARERYTRKESA
jgi:hypothetical protein